MKRRNRPLMFGRASLLMETTDDMIRLAILYRNGTVTDCQQILLQAGVIKDGEILDNELVTARLRHYLLRKKPRNAAVILHSTRVFIRFALLPLMREKEMGKVVEGSYEDHFPLFQDEMTMSWKCTGVQAGKAQIMMAAIPTATVMSYIPVFEELRMEIQYIDCFESCLLDFFMAYERVVVVYQKGDRLAFLYKPHGAGIALWDVSVEEADGYAEMIRSYVYYVMRDEISAIDSVYALCACPEWVRAFFAEEGAAFLQPNMHACKVTECCFVSAALRRRL